MNKKLIDLGKLQSFMRVAEHLNFTEAAQNLYIGQPALSRKIAALEDELGVRLFIRSTRSVQLTPAGRLLLQEAEELIAKVEKIMDRTKNADCGVCGSLTVGSLLIGRMYLPRVIKTLRLQHPNIKVHVNSDSASKARDALKDGTLDISFMLAFEAHNASWLARQRIYEDTLCIVLPHDHSLADKEHLKLSHLAQEPFIIFPRSAGPLAYDDFLQLCLNGGFSPNIVSTPSGLESIILQIESGIGISILPRNIVSAYSKTLKLINIAGDVPNCEVDVVWNAHNDNPALPLFLNALESHLRTNRSSPTAFQ